MSARMRGHSADRVCCTARSAPNAPIHQMRRGVRSQSSDWTWRRTSAWNRGEPLAGGSVSGGMGSPAANRSRTYQLIPPHRPAEASPMPIQRGSIGPKVRVGPGGKRFAKRNPFVLGRKSGTAFDSTIGQSLVRARSPPRSTAGLYHRRDGCADERRDPPLSPGRPTPTALSRCCSRTRAGRISPSATSVTGRSRRVSPTAPRPICMAVARREFEEETGTADRPRGAGDRARIDRPEGRQGRLRLGGRGRPGPDDRAFQRIRGGVAAAVGQARAVPRDRPGGLVRP